MRVKAEHNMKGKSQSKVPHMAKRLLDSWQRLLYFYENLAWKKPND